MPEKLNGRDASGLSVKADADNMPLPLLVFYLLMNLVFLGLGQAAAWAVYLNLGSGKVEAKLAFLADFELAWLFIAAFVLKTGLVLLNAIAAVWRKEARVNVPDQHVYKVFTPPGQEPLPYVLMAEEGALGCFNRAQRAAQNYVEYLPGMVGYVLLAGFVFPLPVFVCTVAYVSARILMAVKYIHTRESRLAGFLLSNLSVSVVEGLLLLCAGKVLALQYANGCTQPGASY
eukprot:EG_transcript_16011